MLTLSALRKSRINVQFQYKNRDEYDVDVTHVLASAESPEFEEPLVDTGADENKPLTLKVKILAVPEPEVTW